MSSIAAAWVQKKTNKTLNSYTWRDGPVQNQVIYTPDMAAPAAVNTSTYAYDIIGGQAQLKSVSIVDGRSRTVSFVNDFLGQGIKRDEADALAGGDPHEIWYRFGGRQQGYVGNNGSIDTTYTQSVDARDDASGTGAFRNGAAASTSFADFDLAYDAINSYEQGSKGGVYTVQAGDTLASIASALWGDSALWYKLAEVNGLSAESALIEGQPLLIPVGVVRNTNNSRTFQPYDPLEVLGDTAPTTPVTPKPKKNKCGVFGAILLVIIAAVVTVLTYGATSEWFVGALGNLGGAIAAGAFSGAVGSIASQAVGVATGIQDKFSWNAVALAAISAGATKGLSKLTAFGGAGAHASEATQKAHLLANTPGLIQQAGLAMAASAITQGVGVATGLQKEFSWAGVAGAGVGAALGGWVGRNVSGGVGAILASSADAIGDAATRSLIDGTDFGDNIIAALPSVIGNAIARGIVGGISKQMEKSRNDRADRQRLEALRVADEERRSIEWGRQALNATPLGDEPNGVLSDGLTLDGETSGLWTEIDATSTPGGYEWVLEPDADGFRGTVRVPRPWMAPMELNEDTRGFHRYTFRHRIEGAERLPSWALDEILRENAVPNDWSKPATLEGANNDAGDLWGVPAPFSQVNSYERTSESGQYWVINVTRSWLDGFGFDGGLHILNHGWVAGTFYRNRNGMVDLLTYGEGNGFLQSRDNPDVRRFDRMNRDVWNQRAAHVQRDVNRALQSHSLRGVWSWR